MTRAYSTPQASVIVQCDYAALPIIIMWGFLFWREVPTLMTLAGASLTLASGMYLLVQDQKKRSEKPQVIITQHQIETLE